MDNFSQFCQTKAFEIAYAIFRVSHSTKRSVLTEHLETQVLELLRASSASDYQAVGAVLGFLDKLVKLWIEFGPISFNNGQLITAEIENLSSAIAEYGKPLGLPDVDLSSVFTERQFVISNQKSQEKKEESDSFSGAGVFGENSNVYSASDVAVHEDLASEREEVQQVRTEEDATKSPDPRMRQSAILDRIRQSGYCRLKDLISIMPDVSERTVRYDLQELIEQNLVERIGSSGPASFYRLKRKEV